MTDPAERNVSIDLPDVTLPGDLVLPEEPVGLVVFAHGSGSSRKSPRNRFVAGTLHERGLATLLFDLLTEAEDREYERRFDIDLLTERLVGATDWAGEQSDLAELPFGYFGSSTGAAAALRAAVERPAARAVVSRGGRVDLAGEALDEVEAATLFVVGGADESVLARNREAHEKLAGEKELVVVEGAGHLFEEEGALAAVADVAGEWFVEQLG